MSKIYQKMYATLAGRVDTSKNTLRRAKRGGPSLKKGPGAEAPGPFPAQRYVRYSRLFSSALLNRCMTLPPKVMLILAP